MHVTFEKKEAFRVIGFEAAVPDRDAYAQIPKLWAAYAEQHMAPLLAKAGPESALEQAIFANMIGEYGICIDDAGQEGTIRYLIAGIYQGGPVPAGLTLREIPAMEWAIFSCTGPMPGALQAVNTEVFSHWLPENGEYAPARKMSVEWYSQGDMSAPDYQSAIWVPVVKTH